MTTRRKGPAAKRARSGKPRPNPAAWSDQDYAERHGLGRISLRLPTGLLEALDAEAGRSEQTRQTIVGLALMAYLARRGVVG